MAFFKKPLVLMLLMPALLCGEGVMRPCSTAALGNSKATSVDQATRDQVLEAYGKLPLVFELNQGQTDPQVKFMARGNGYNLFLTPSETVLALHDPVAPAVVSETDPVHRRLAQIRQAREAARSVSVLRMSLVGANPQPVMVGVDELPGKSHYLTHRGAQGASPTEVPLYARVECREVYRGVNMVYYGAHAAGSKQLEYDLVVSPGADPGQIRLAFEGVQQLNVNEQGALVMQTGEGKRVTQHAPLIYQEINGTRQIIPGKYTLLPSSWSDAGIRHLPQIGFQIAHYDTAKPLFIDPILSYSTYLGGSDYDFGWDVAVDSQGKAYVTGWTYSADFPLRRALQRSNAGSYDAFVVKLNATGTALAFATYLGGNADDYALGIDVLEETVAGVTSVYPYVVGHTDSTDFPVSSSALYGSNAGLIDAFVARLNAGGSALTYATYLGGSADDCAMDIAVDTAGSAYVAGYTTSTDFQTTAGVLATSNAGLTDAFVAQFSPNGSTLTYSTYLGGTGDDYALGIDLFEDTADTYAYVAGYTDSATISVGTVTMTNAGLFDGFVAKVNDDATALDYITGLGGTSDDYATDVAVDGDDCAYIAGYTGSSDLAVQATAPNEPFQEQIAGSYDAFAAKLLPDGTFNASDNTQPLTYATYLGGEDFDVANGIAVDGSGRAYVAGSTWSLKFPTKSKPFQTAYAGNGDAFITALGASGSDLRYSSYLGGRSYDTGSNVAVDSASNAYVIGYSYSDDFPASQAVQAENAGFSDAVVAKIASGNSPQANLVVSSLTGPSTAVIGKTISLVNGVKNEGVATANAFQVAFYLSKDSTITPGLDRFLGSRAVTGLKAGTISNATTILMIPPNLRAGSYYLGAVVDHSGAIEESDETDNTKVKTGVIQLTTIRADLVVTSLSSSVNTAKGGQIISVSNRVLNQGTGAARSFSVGFYLSTDMTVTTGDTFLGSRFVADLKATAGSSVSTKLMIPTGVSGNYYIGAIADDEDLVIELNESNNTKAGTRITVSP